MKRKLCIIKSNAGYYIGTVELQEDNTYQPYERMSGYMTEEEAIEEFGIECPNHKS